MEHLHRLEQRDVDRVYGLLRTSVDSALPKGISGPTLALVNAALRDAAAGLTAVEVAARAGISPGVARRYLKFLSDSGAIDFALRYGSAGRPEHQYRWVSR
jgi:two-component system CitB family response regulator